MMRNIGYTLLILAGIAVFAIAQDATTFTTLAVTGTSTFTGAITATGGVSGATSGTHTGAVVATTLTASSEASFADTVAFSEDAVFAAAVVCSSTVEVQGVLTASGGVVGNVTGKASIVDVPSVADVTALPAAAAGNAGYLYSNTGVDSLWISTGSAWTLIYP